MGGFRPRSNRCATIKPASCLDAVLTFDAVADALATDRSQKIGFGAAAQ